jgi:hypothetical protein
MIFILIVNNQTYAQTNLVFNNAFFFITLLKNYICFDNKKKLRKIDIITTYKKLAFSENSCIEGRNFQISTGV